MIGAFASLAVLPETALAQRPATPVDVINPSTAPVPTTVLNPATQPALTRNVDDPGRIAYQSQQIFTCQVNAPGGSAGCLVQFSAVPTGQRLVIQQLSVGLTADVTVSYAIGAVALSTARSQFSAPGLGPSVSFSQPMLLYVDGGISAVLELLVVGISQGGTFSANASIIGYLLDCSASSATPCNPIAGQ
jgi:hypothetical protein